MHGATLMIWTLFMGKQAACAKEKDQSSAVKRRASHIKFSEADESAINPAARWSAWVILPPSRENTAPTGVIGRLPSTIFHENINHDRDPPRL